MILTQKQEAFAFNIAVKQMTQHDAYMAAYNTKRMLPATIDEESCKLRAFPKINTRIQELRKEHRRADVADYEERQRILTEITRGRLGQFIRADGEVLEPDPDNLMSSALQEIKTTHFTGGKDGRASEKTTTIKLHNPIQAIAELNKMDHVYETSQAIQDNRTINFIVMGEKSKELVSKIKEVTKKLIEGEAEE